MSGAVVVVIEHDRGVLAPAATEALTAGRELAARIGAPLHALTIGAAADDLAATAAAYGATVVFRADHELLADYNPEAWGETVAALISSERPSVVLATGTDRGNEVLAQAGARTDLAFVANCLSFQPDEAFEVRRVRWGGSLVERAAVAGDTRLFSVALHAVDAAPAPIPGAGEVRPLAPSLGSAQARTVIVDRVERAAGVTLATAPVVVGGGRGVGSADGFVPLQTLADLLGGVVGCSRAVTNLGWRNHTDQVGQTGTRIAPDIYIACGISGAIQHWVGAMASKTILAINTDPQANMVTKSDYAVIGDLHQVVPAITAEVIRRRNTLTA
jgi:electron transfer flavoprotein alpha subunit